MNKNQLAELGISPEDVLNRVAETICSGMRDEEGYYIAFTDEVEKKVREYADAQIQKALATHIEPRVIEMTEGIILQETTKWGEKIGEPKTFIEYMADRVDAYIREPVDYNGKDKSESGYDFRAKTSRIAHMIHCHLQYNIKAAVEKALKTANDSIRGGLEEAVKTAISNVKISTNVRS